MPKAYIETSDSLMSPVMGIGRDADAAKVDALVNSGGSRRDDINWRHTKLVDASWAALASWEHGFPDEVVVGQDGVVRWKDEVTT